MITKVSGIVLTLLLMTMLLTIQAATTQTLESLRLVAFGSQSCPHCRALHNFFSKNYVGIYTFFWVEDRVSSELFAYLARVEISYGLSNNYAYAVPQTLVLSEGKAVAIVIGEVTNASFWNHLLNSKANATVPIYLGSSEVVMSIPQESLTQLITNIYSMLKTSPTTISTQSGASTSIPNTSGVNLNLLGVIIIAVGVALAVAYFIVRSRKLY